MVRSEKKSLPARGRAAFARQSAPVQDDTRAQLSAAARDLFLEGGVANVSLREVARRVGVSAPAVYRHFDGKEALVAAACTQGFEVFSSYLVRSLHAPTARERLLATTDQYRRFAEENPRDYRFIFMSPADEIRRELGPNPNPKDLSPVTQGATFRFLVDRVRECMDENILAKDSPEKVAVLIWAHVHGLVSLRLSDHLSQLGDNSAFAALYRESVERMLASLGR
jgi:AcrR family transcriptional regulator